MNRKKSVKITEKYFMDLVKKIQVETQEELDDEGFSEEIKLMDMLSSLKFAMELKDRIFTGDEDEE